jgi:putative ABC transport system permease protein
MSIRDLWRRIRNTARNGLPDVEFDAEIKEHVRLLREHYRRQGMTEEEASQAARRQFGNQTLLQEDRRAMKTIPAVESIRCDLVYATRMLRKNPGFTVAAAITLALGIGANAAIFSICNSLLFKPLPFDEPDRIVMLWERGATGALMTVAPANFVDWRNQTRSFREMAAINPNSSFILGSQNEAVRLAGAAVSSNFFSLLGVRFAMGRNFTAEEERPGNNRVAILSYRIWQERFGADPDIVGSQIKLNDASYTVAAVLPADFRFGSRAADFQPRNQGVAGDQFVVNAVMDQFDIWVPLAFHQEHLQRGTHPLRVIARLRPAVPLAQAQAELNVLGTHLASQYPADNRDKGIRAVPLQEQATGTIRVALQMLLIAVGLVLLIACANVANLLLSRAAGRRSEMAVRVALGAGRWRIAQQLLTESLLLAGIAGTAGFFLALIAMAVLGPYLPADLSRAGGVTPDARILAFTAFISLASGIVFGLSPLIGTAGERAGEWLKASTRVAGGGQSLLRNGLAVAQIAIALLLLIGTGLMVRSFVKLIHVPPGFRSEGILTARLSLPAARYPDNHAIAAYERELLERLKGSPGMQSAGFTTYLPLSGSDNGWAFIIEGRPPLPTGIFNMAKYRPVSAGYFETLGIPLLRGRSFARGDESGGSPWVVVVNAALAREYWGAEDPIGQRLMFGSETWRTVIGVVVDVRHEGLGGETKPEMYVPMDHAPNVERDPTMVVQAALDAGSAASQLRELLSAADRTVSVDRIETMDRVVSGSVAQPRFRTFVLAAFSLLALVMASIGVYGVINYLVTQRTREFGIRMSMGATQTDVLRLVLRRAAALIGAGTCLGLAGATLLVRFLAKLLFETAPVDPLTFVIVPVVLATVALLASYVPARRATRVDPMIALRYE